MRRTISIALAAATALSSLTASVAPGQAAMLAQTPAVAGDTADVVPIEDRRPNNEWWYNPRNRGGWDRGGRHGWRGHGGWDDDDDWRGHRRHWRGRDWDDNDDNGAALALGLFGFAAGAMLGGQAFGGGPVYGGGGSCGPYDAHDRACDNRFRSYDWCSNTYMGYDGYRHYC